MPYLKPDEPFLHERNIRYIKRVFFLRQTGTLLCYPPILSALLENEATLILHILLILNMLIWPYLALQISKHSTSPPRTEKYNLILDAGMGGGWIACMGASPFPSAIIIAVQIADRFAAGGWKMLRPALLCQLSVFIAIWLLAGKNLTTDFSNRTVWLTLPLATVYPVLLSVVSRRLSSRIRERCESLERLALMDPGLDLPNRRFFEQKLAKAYQATSEGENCSYLMLIDVDNFKNINDNYGHEAGDALLARISSTLRDSIEQQDIPARFGGDELAIIIRDSTDENVVLKATEIQKKILNIFLPSYRDIHCTVSIGISSARGKGSITEWFHDADTMLYNVKRNGKNGYRLHE